MATLAVATPVSRAGITLVGAAVSASDKFANSGRQFLAVINANVASTVVTITTQATVDGNAVADPAVTVLTGTTKLIGPFPPSTFNDSNGDVTVGFSVTSSVTVLVLSAVPETVQS
jgi:hypothetical protein